MYKEVFLLLIILLVCIKLKESLGSLGKIKFFSFSSSKNNYKLKKLFKCVIDINENILLKLKIKII